MLLAWLTRLQTLCAAGVLLWLGAALALIARDGFVPARERYAPLETSGVGGFQVLRQMLPRSGGVVAALGRAPEIGGEPAPVEKSLERLAETGVEIRRCDTADVYEAARGAHFLCVTHDRPEYRVLDWPRLAAALAAPAIADFSTMIPGDITDAAGLEVVNFGRPTWPAWLDPEYRLFAEHVRRAIPDEEAGEARILLLAGQPYRTFATRARWFLMLNYELAPRRFYLWQPVEASGYVMQFFGWAAQVNAPERWRDARLVHLKERALSRLERSTSSPTRCLTPAELAAAEALGTDWVLMQTPNSDFRLVDWELLPIERVRSWSESPR